MRTAGGAVTSADIAGIDTKNKKYTQKGITKSRSGGEMKLLKRYLDELRRNKSADASSNVVQSTSDFEAVFSEGGVKIGM